ncbi:MAG: hypothetical protein ABSG21_04560 [Spirochaetia bacterium]
MKVSSPYREHLDAAIETRRQWLEAEQIPLLREALATFESLFEGAMGMLIRKGLLREDPYNYEQTFSDIKIPKDDALPEFENSDEVSYRLAAYRRQLKYVSTEYPLDLATINLARARVHEGPHGRRHHGVPDPERRRSPDREMHAPDPRPARGSHLLLP